jgi:hypothetical protein
VHDSIVIANGGESKVEFGDLPQFVHGLFVGIGGGAAYIVATVAALEDRLFELALRAGQTVHL